MTDFYSTPTGHRPVPSLRIAGSADVDDIARTVVVAYRNDAPAAVLTQAIAAARREEAALRIVVFSTDSPAGPMDNDPAETEELAGILAEAGLPFEIQRADSDVASQILDLAEEWAAELIVLSTRRRSTMMKLLLGSSIQRVILEADCPVLVVK